MAQSSTVLTLAGFLPRMARDQVFARGLGDQIYRCHGLAGRSPRLSDQPTLSRGLSGRELPRAAHILNSKRAIPMVVEEISANIVIQASNLRRSGEAGESYEDWIRNYDTLRFGDRYRIRKQIEAYKLKPRFSVLMTVSAPAAGHLKATIESVRALLYPSWKLCIIADESLLEETHRIIRLAERDCRIEVRHRGEQDEIADAFNEALAPTDVEFVFFLGGEDKLAPTALY